MYTRRDVCTLTGIEESRFKTLARREQLPTLRVVPNDEDEQASGWNRFNSFEVIQLAIAERLMCQIGYADGLRPDTAAKIASQCGEGIETALRRSAADIWVGYVGVPAERGGVDGGMNVHGTFFQIAKRLAELGDGPAERVFLVNVSEVVRAIKQRADEHRLLFPNDESVAE